MKRPSDGAWFEKQECGPLFVFFTVHPHDELNVSVDWSICADDGDKCEERALAGSDNDICGTKAQLTELINLAMRRARESARRIANNMLAWAAEED